MLIHAKCLVPKAGDRELARVVHASTGHSLHHETVKALLKRYFFWQYSEFREAVRYSPPANPEQQRLEMRCFKEQGQKVQRFMKKPSEAKQLRLYLGPELIKSA